MDGFSTNAVGAHITTRAFLALLHDGQGKTVVNVSSAAASTTTFSDLVILDLPAA
jgi:NAD(P)-dependent dehydrogenase (short-subunit alcohol dehydrogenase family)